MKMVIIDWFFFCFFSIYISLPRTLSQDTTLSYTVISWGLYFKRLGTIFSGENIIVIELVLLFIFDMITCKSYYLLPFCLTNEQADKETLVLSP